MYISKWDDNTIFFSDGSTITYEHEADCCELNWADFSTLELFYQGQHFDDYSVERVEDIGFNLVLMWGINDGIYRADARIFIPCYSDQNGCYSSDLDIIIHNKSQVRFPMSAILREN